MSLSSSAHHAPTQRRTRLAWHFKRTHPNMARFGILAVLAAGLNRKSGGWIASCAGACVTPQTRAARSDGVDLAHLALDVSHTLLHDAARCTEVRRLIQAQFSVSPGNSQLKCCRHSRADNMTLICSFTSRAAFMPNDAPQRPESRTSWTHNRCSELLFR